MSEKRFGCTCVVDAGGKLTGIITDGDLRRLMKSPEDLTAKRADEIMNPHPIVVPTGCLAKEALSILENHNILQLVIIEDSGGIAGMVHLHDMLEAGIEQQ
jgi:arabinose-5-phosphate isomerase